MNIYLIGYRCTGKTSVGKAFAKRLGWVFIDADTELVNEHGLSIKEMVSAQGWDSFRRKERAVLQRVCALDQQVVATGGGAVLDRKNVSDMKKSGALIWLRALPETIRKRIRVDKGTGDFRPSLTAKSLQDEIEETLSDREPLYKNAMDFFVDTDGRSIEDICDTMIQMLKEGNRRVLWLGPEDQVSDNEVKE